MSIQAPPKLLVEKYLIEIAKIFNVEYEPDPQVMKSDSRPEGFLIDLDGRNNLDGDIPLPPGPGFLGYPQPPNFPILPHPPANVPFNYPPGPNNNNGNNNGGGFGSLPSGPSNMNYNIPPNNQEPEKKDLNINTSFINVSIIFFVISHICFIFSFNVLILGGKRVYCKATISSITKLSTTKLCFFKS